jgi:hypothetical protein
MDPRDLREGKPTVTSIIADTIAGTARLGRGREKRRAARSPAGQITLRKKQGRDVRSNLKPAHARLIPWEIKMLHGLSEILVRFGLGGQLGTFLLLVLVTAVLVSWWQDNS